MKRPSFTLDRKLSLMEAGENSSPCVSLYYVSCTCIDVAKLPLDTMSDVTEALVTLEIKSHFILNHFCMTKKNIFFFFVLRNGLYLYLIVFANIPRLKLFFWLKLLDIPLFLLIAHT